VFSSRFQELAFHIAVPGAYNFYRLQIDSVANPAAANSVQLSEIELLGAPMYAYWWNFGDGTSSMQQNPQHTYTNTGAYPVTLGVTYGIYSGTNTATIVVGAPLATTLTATPVGGLAPLTVQFAAQGSGGQTYHYPYDTTDDRLGTITAQGQNSGSDEVAANAFDNSVSTKWLDFANAYPSTRSSWIQYQYPGGRQFNLTQYTITSANDHAERDPANWRLLGSNNGGGTWTTLDIQSNQVFAARYQKLVYNLTNNSAFNLYRLQIDSVANPATANSIQLSELEFITLPPPYSYSWSFGDGGFSSAQNPQHTFAVNGLYAVILVVSDGLSSVTNNVLISVGPPSLVLSQAGGNIQLSWPTWTTNYSYRLYAATNLVAPVAWTFVTNSVVEAGGVLSVTLPLGAGSRFFQLRGP